MTFFGVTRELGEFVEENHGYWKFFIGWIFMGRIFLSANQQCAKEHKAVSKRNPALNVTKKNVFFLKGRDQWFSFAYNDKFRLDISYVLRFFFLVVYIYICMLVFSHIFLSTTSLVNKDVYIINDGLQTAFGST